MNFAELTQVALLGTERQTLTPPKDAGALGQLQSQLDLNRRENSLLAAAALAGLHEQIGRLPFRDVGPVPDPCSPEESPRMSERAGSILLQLLSGEHAVLLREFLTLAKHAGQVALPEVLPQLLALGGNKIEPREEIAPILGARGQWLATQNAEWAWVRGTATDDERIWEVGEPPARLMFLQRLRRSNPGCARELLIATWKDESPDDRARFVAALEAGLSPEDETFLESALDDKRKEVRQAAAVLLARLPESALVKRMTERVKQLLRFIPAESSSLLKLKKAKPAVIEVTLPAECDKAMQRDGIEVKPRSTLGERAWWMIQMLEVVPLDLWTNQWRISPGDVVAASGESEWKAEFLLAWLRAAVRQRNSIWAENLFSAAFENRHLTIIGDLLSVMPPASREARLSELLASSDPKAAEFRGYLVTNAKFQWSASFSKTVLSWLKRLAAEKSSDWQLRSQLKDLAAHPDPSALTDALNGWPTDSEGWDFWSKGVDEFLSAVQFRADMHAAFVNHTHS